MLQLQHWRRLLPFVEISDYNRRYVVAKMNFYHVSECQGECDLVIFMFDISNGVPIF